MSEFPDLQRVYDMRECCHRIRMYAAGLSRELFFDTDVVFDATMYNLLILGEAVNHMPDDIITAFPNIPWRELVGFRNRIAHEYQALDNDTVWEIVSHGVAELREQLDDLLAELEAEEPIDGS